MENKIIDIEKIKVRLGQEIEYSTLSQTEIAKHVGVSQQQISCYMHGKKLPALDTFATLCKILNADPAYILCLTD